MSSSPSMIKEEHTPPISPSRNAPARSGDKIIVTELLSRKHDPENDASYSDAHGHRISTLPSLPKYKPAFVKKYGNRGYVVTSPSIMQEIQGINKQSQRQDARDLMLRAFRSNGRTLKGLGGNHVKDIAGSRYVRGKRKAEVEPFNE
ncbi:hypothetical protein LTS18_001604 [Coniosporium uncinatum]|uniref:Uncharacterized protein n=1 Tax=Coniosporium uncinatum TaxID=93489 RepID=A0ACC3DUD2_9PEZI|nr:hypothetical protein LTS18_001604 [Coniosporium uncinatum]